MVGAWRVCKITMLLFAHFALPPHFNREASMLIGAVLPPPTIASARSRAHLRPWRRDAHAYRVPRASGDENGQTPASENRVVKITFVLPTNPDGGGSNEDDVREVQCEARVGDNLLSAAMRCGAVDPDETAQFCLEGRCDSCLMEDVNTGEVLRGCQDAAWEPAGDESVRLWIGGDGGDLLPLDAWMQTDGDEDEGPDGTHDEDDPFGLIKNPIDVDPILEWIEGDLRAPKGVYDS